MKEYIADLLYHGEEASISSKSLSCLLTIIDKLDDNVNILVIEDINSHKIITQEEYKRIMNLWSINDE